MEDGSSISVFKDRWIPRPSSFKVVTLDSGSSLMVAYLIDKPNYAWNVDILDRSFLPFDKEAILSIPLS